MRRMHNWKISALWFFCLMLIVTALVMKISGSLYVEQPLPQDADSLIKNPVVAYPAATTSILQTIKNSAPVKRPSPTPPKEIITAKSYLVGNLETGHIYFKRNPSLVLPVASMSKLITAVAALDTLDRSTIIEITPENLEVAGETTNLKAGERYTLDEALHPLLLSSSNATAEALASTSKRSGFLELMSSYAWEIGMSSTYFADPSGLNPRNASTAEDFFALARYLYSSKPEILKLTRIKAYGVPTTTDHGSHIFSSTHPFSGTPNFLGGKTGHTPTAKDTMLSIFSVSQKPIAIIVLGSDNRRSDTQLLLKQVEKVISTKTR